MFSSFFPNWINILLLGFQLVNKSASLDCYLCGGDEPNNYPCTEFQSWDSKYIKACEGNSQSCRISQRVKDKMILSRSCENIKLNDCKTANAIEYCYCTNNLCNKFSPSDMNEELDDKDDESIEDIEGSGSKNVEQKSSPHNPNILATITSTTEKPTTNVTKLGKSSNTSSDPKVSSSSVLQNNVYLTSLILMMITFLNSTKQY